MGRRSLGMDATSMKQSTVRRGIPNNTWEDRANELCNDAQPKEGYKRGAAYGIMHPVLP